MSMGQRVRKLRLELGLSQRDVADAAGLGVSYLSRLENGRTTPSARSLAKLAAALDVPPVVFFDSNGSLEDGDRCPVSMGGGCILDQPLVSTGRRPTSGEVYTREQLQTLRAVNYLLHHSSSETRTTLECTVRALMSLESKRHGEQGDDEAE